MSKLYLIPTPIGNLEDITLRAIRILKEVDLILAEDTRTSSRLLNHYSISTHLQSHHKYNEHNSIAHIASQISSGLQVALISDAGTPAISDPGYLLVRECLNHSIEVECLPGATAFVPALVNSGLSTDRFYFEGFLPPKKGRNTRLKYLAGQDSTIVLYESPYRLYKTLSQLADVLGNERLASVSRELTKIHEENRRGTLGELAAYYQNQTVKGELVIVVDGKRKYPLEK